MSNYKGKIGDIKLSKVLTTSAKSNHCFTFNTKSSYDDLDDDNRIIDGKCGEED